MAVSQGTQAFQQAGAAVVEAIVTGDEKLEDLAERFIRSADPHQITGRRGERFEWSFGYDDVPAIVAEARKILRTGDRHTEKPLSLRLGADRRRVEDAAKQAGVPVRKWITTAVQEKLERWAADPDARDEWDA